jgi:hypothetical protein
MESTQKKRSGSMIVECWAIVTIVLAIAFIFLRAGRKPYFFGMLPVIFAPAAHILAYVLSKPLGSLFHTAPGRIYAVFDLLALIAACICFGIFSCSFKGRRTKILYLSVCGIFTLILSLILIFDALALI